MKTILMSLALGAALFGLTRPARAQCGGAVVGTNVVSPQVTFTPTFLAVPAYTCPTAQVTTTVAYPQVVAPQLVTVQAAPAVVPAQFVATPLFVQAYAAPLVVAHQHAEFVSSRVVVPVHANVVRFNTVVPVNRGVNTVVRSRTVTVTRTRR